MQQRVLSKSGQLSCKVYKFDSQIELESEKNKAKRYGNNHQIKFSGIFSVNDQRIICAMAQDDAYKELNLKPGDYYMLTEENIFNILEIQNSRSFKEKHVGTRNLKRDMVLNNLYAGTPQEVAAMCDVDVSTVYSYRKRDKEMKEADAIEAAARETKEENLEKISLTLPKENENMEKQKRVKWTAEEIALFNDKSIEEVSKITGRTFAACSWKKYENKKPKQPKEPKVQTPVAPGTQKPSKFWSKKEIALFKQDLTVKQISEMTGRNENAVILKKNRLIAAKKLPKKSRVKQSEVIASPIVEPVKKTMWQKFVSIFK